MQAYCKLSFVSTEMVAIKIIEKNKLDSKMTKMVLREITVTENYKFCLEI